MIKNVDEIVKNLKYGKEMCKAFEVGDAILEGTDRVLRVSAPLSEHDIDVICDAILMYAVFSGVEKDAITSFLASLQTDKKSLCDLYNNE